MSSTPQAKVANLLVSLPSYDGRRVNGSAMVDLCGIQNLNVRFREHMSSLLTLGFNQAWAEALNSGADFFLMLHDDIHPVTPKWPAILFQELTENDADVISVVSPIKTALGLTSTAVETDDPWNPRRYSMTEIMEKPETWAEDGLLVNTGLMLVDMREPWVNDICFTINDRLVWKDGKYVAEVQPEDWNFSRQVIRAGGKIVATRKIEIDHIGRAAYTNAGAWGTAETDPVYQEVPA